MTATLGTPNKEGGYGKAPLKVRSLCSPIFQGYRPHLGFYQPAALGTTGSSSAFLQIRSQSSQIHGQHIDTQICIHARIHIRRRMRICVHMHIHDMHVHVRKHTLYLSIYACRCVIRVNTYTHIHVYICVFSSLMRMYVYDIYIYIYASYMYPCMHVYMYT